MNNITLNLRTGQILLEDSIIAPLRLDDLLNVALEKNIKLNNLTRNNEWPTYEIDGKLRDQNFSINISYKEKDIWSVWFVWDGGIAGKKGYDATERDLINDKNSLTKLLISIIQREPNEKKYNYNVFFFDWGRISVSASIKSTMVTIGITWNKNVCKKIL